MSEPTVDICSARRRNLNLDMFEKCGSGTRSATSFPDCAFICVMASASVRTEKGWRSICVQGLGSDNECWDGYGISGSISYDGISISQLFLDDALYCCFKLLVVEAT